MIDRAVDEAIRGAERNHDQARRLRYCGCMAPRAPETFEAFVERLRRVLSEGGTEIRFGQHHFSHAVCVEDDAFRVRRLECTAQEAEAYLREHGVFMPEHAEQISVPRTVVVEAPTLQALTELLGARWPL